MMKSTRPLDVLVGLVCLAGGIAYMATDNDIKGVVVVLLGILYFLAVPRIIKGT